MEFTSNCIELYLGKTKCLFIQRPLMDVKFSRANTRMDFYYIYFSFHSNKLASKSPEVLQSIIF